MFCRSEIVVVCEESGVKETNRFKEKNNKVKISWALIHTLKT